MRQRIATYPTLQRLAERRFGRRSAHCEIAPPAMELRLNSATAFNGKCEVKGSNAVKRLPLLGVLYEQQFTQSFFRSVSSCFHVAVHEHRDQFPTIIEIVHHRINVGVRWSHPI